jgi:diguanylate cyclase (GGDEF)-like protein
VSADEPDEPHDRSRGAGTPADPDESHRQATRLDADRILSSIGEAAYEWRIDTDALAWGANVRDVLSVDADEIATGRTYARLLDPENVETRFDAVMRTGRHDDGSGVQYRAEYRLRLEDEAGNKIWIEDTGRWFAAADGRPLRAHGLVRAINERRENHERLAYLSRFDGLTGEMNRVALTEVLGEAIEETKRFHTSCACLLVAVDNLARLNHSFGFDVADEVIAAVCRRIRSTMRAGDSLGRFSGNNLGVILKNCMPGDMETAAERFLACVREETVETSAGPISATVTLGGVAAPRHARSVHEVLARAQEALDAAKARRRGSFLAYQPSVEREEKRRENIRATDEIVTALNERRILLAYEPVVRTRSRDLVLYECLTRIRRADGTLIPAGLVIPIAERLGLVGLIDHRVLELVVEELVADPSLVVSMNVSAASTNDPDWWNALSSRLRAHPGVAPRLVIEITETAAIQDLAETRGFVTRVKDLGSRIAIDDFGAGNTSFRNLRKLGVDIVKIDGGFVQNLTGNVEDQIFVRALIELARGLGLMTVAEWVQDEATAALLAEWGCDCLQGRLIGLASAERPNTRQARAIPAR